MYNKNGNTGFSAIEVIITIVILSILSAFAFFQFKKLGISTILEKNAVMLKSDMSGFRALSMKSDCGIIVNFENNKFTIYKDLDNNGTTDATVKVVNLNSQIRLALPQTAPSVPLKGVDINAGIGGLWNTAGLVIERSTIGRMNSGYVVVSSARLPEVAYVIGCFGSAQRLTMYKWTGSSWIEL
jgi:prepilin-type N-terminal cleavage/methylation domain-containing protein